VGSLRGEIQSNAPAHRTVVRGRQKTKNAEASKREKFSVRRRIRADRNAAETSSRLGEPMEEGWGGPESIKEKGFGQKFTNSKKTGQTMGLRKDGRNLAKGKRGAYEKVFACNM